MGSFSHDDEANHTGRHRALPAGALASAAALKQQIDDSVQQLQQLVRDEGVHEITIHDKAGNVVTVEVKAVGMSKTTHVPGMVVLSSAARDHELAKPLETSESLEPSERVDLNLFLHGLERTEAETLQRLLGKNLRSLVAAARQENAEHRIQQLIQAIAPPDPLADVQVKVAEATLSLRKDFLDEVPVLTSAEVHANAGFPGGNASQTVHRWRKQGKIFSINHGGRELYPAFQFGSDGRPLPIIAEVLEILKRDSERSDWDNALWFAGDSGWLDGKTPIECLQSDPVAVKRAAEQEVLVDEY